MKLDIYNINKEQLIMHLESLNQKKFRAEQIWHWLYVERVQNFQEMSNLKADLQESLNEKFFLSNLKIAQKQVSNDGTIKWLFGLNDNKTVETVYIPEENRGTLCISSQVGCVLSCSFCHTGTQKFVRNLTASEIIQQVLTAKDEISDWQKDSKITNIVLMGMGEPLCNYDSVAQAVKVLTDQKALNIPKSKITLSTAGVVPLIAKVGEELGVHLAISLHSPLDSVRDILVPLNKKYNIELLINACRLYPANKHHRITFEYVMLDGINDRIEDAKKLALLIQGIPSKINLIPFNPWPGSDYKCSSKEQIELFTRTLNKDGCFAFVRTPRGQDILAACGQLKTACETKSKSILKSRND